ncbi:MAG: enoyl-CoA hydratase/isomerase family protein [Actinobacteria bacterium]|nr:enoyl-CoA hydratase/isomerase family protein [Actinomycetota bacterium]
MLITVGKKDGIANLWLDRPDKLNALSAEMWSELPRAAGELANDAEVRVIVVAGRGPCLTVGIDLEMLDALAPPGESEAARRLALMHKIKELQQTFTSLADCPQPVIAAIHGYCLGAGIDLITACDIRWASADAVFSVRETRMGMVADVGTLQRLPRIVNPGDVAELVYSGADINSARALEMRLVTRVLPDQPTLWSEVMSLAGAIADNSPLAVQGAKRVLQAGEGRSVAEALD